MFKKMFVQKRKEMNKEYEKQEKRIKDMKQHGQSKKSAVRFLIFSKSFIYQLYIYFLIVGEKTKG